MTTPQEPDAPQPVRQPYGTPAAPPSQQAPPYQQAPYQATPPSGEAPFQPAQYPPPAQEQYPQQPQYVQAPQYQGAPAGYQQPTQYPQQYAAPASYAGAPQRAAWQEPTRRNPLGRIGYEGRYAASLALVVAGGYELYRVPGSSLYTLLSGTISGIEPSIVVYLMLQALIGFAAVAVGLAFAPTSGARRGVAIAISMVLPFVAVIVGVIRYSRMGATLIPPGASAFVSIAIGNLPFVVILALTTSWLIVRQRPGLSYLVLIATIVVAVVPYSLALAGIAAGASQLILIILGTIITFGMAWLARVIAAATQRSTTPSGAPVGA